MKLEKREISLNELDSITDALCAEKLLVLEYARGLEKAKRKEIRSVLIETIKEIGEDIFLLTDLKTAAEENNG